MMAPQNLKKSIESFRPPIDIDFDWEGEIHGAHFHI